MKLSNKFTGFLRNIKVSVSVVIVFVIIQIIIIGTAAYTISKLQTNRIEKSTNQFIDHHFSLIKKSIEIAESNTGNGFTAEDYEILKPSFGIRVFASTTKLISVSGEVLISDMQEGTSQLGLKNHNYRNIQKHGKQYYDDNSGTLEFFDYIPQYDAFIVVDFDSDILYAGLKSNKLIIIGLALSILIIMMFVLYRLSIVIMKPLEIINNKMIDISQGKLVEKSDYLFNNEFGSISKSLNRVIDGVANNAIFAEELANNNYDADFKVLSDDDVLGTSLFKMRDSLKAAVEKEKRNKEIEDRNNWMNTGIAKFSDILRENLSQKELASKIVSGIVNYIGANQGGLFIFDDSDSDNKVLNLEAAYAFSRHKFLEKHILVGEGLVGTCAIEMQTIHLTEIPETYAEITSGLGNSAPRSILIVPLLVEDQLFGVLEIASLNDFKDFEIEFIEKLAESIAITMANVKRNSVTEILLDQSKMQSEELAAQEEEMRQNMEELIATQEESQRRERELISVFDGINRAVNVVKLDSIGNIESINPNLSAVLNTDAFMFSGQHFSNIVKPSEGQIDNQDLWNKLINGELVTRKEIVLINNINAEVSSTYSPIMDDSNQIESVLIIVNN